MASRKQKLTKLVVAQAVEDMATAVARAAKSGAKVSETVIWDNRVQGFGLRIRPSGNTAFFFMYRANGKLKRMTIKANGPDNAYELAKDSAGKHFAGRDPVVEKAQAKEKATKADAVKTVEQVLRLFIEDKAKVELKPKTYIEYERLVDKLLIPHIGKIKVDDLTPQRVKQMQQDLTKELRKRKQEQEKKRAKAGDTTPPKKSQITLPDAAIRVLSSAMSWAEEYGYRSPGPNPAGIRLKASRRRETLLTDNDVGRMHVALDDLEKEGEIQPSVALAIRLLWTTACRADEICRLRWDDVDFDNEILKWDDTKTGALEKPMTEEAKQLLQKAQKVADSPWVCPPSKAAQIKEGKHLRTDVLRVGFKRVMKKAGVVVTENVALHLTRGWNSSKIYGDASIPLPVQMAIVGHESVQTAMRYAKTTREEVRLAAREAEARKRASIDAAKKGNVVLFRREAE